MLHRAHVVLAAAALAVPAAASGGVTVNKSVVPEELAAAVVGSWHLGDDYRVTLSRAGKGLRAHQEATVRLKGRVVRDSDVEYDADARELRFPGVGAIHRTVVTLRRSGPDLEYAVSSEISPGKWTHGAWTKARRE